MNTNNYYDKKLSSLLLAEVYSTEIPRINQYLQAEIEFVRKHIRGDETILELGAGYGRVILELARSCKKIVGIDISPNNIEYGKKLLKDYENAELVVMDAYTMQYKNEFDMTICIQNGLSAIKGNTRDLLKKTIDGLKNGGLAFFSSYHPDFWEYRLLWFYEQAKKGLIGELDIENCRDGVITCKDGFYSRSFSKDELSELGQQCGMNYWIEEIDESSIFLIIQKL